MSHKPFVGWVQSQWTHVVCFCPYCVQTPIFGDAECRLAVLVAAVRQRATRGRAGGGLVSGGYCGGLGHAVALAVDALAWHCAVRAGRVAAARALGRSAVYCAMGLPVSRRRPLRAVARGALVRADGGADAGCGARALAIAAGLRGRRGAARRLGLGDGARRGGAVDPGRRAGFCARASSGALRPDAATRPDALALLSTLCGRAVAAVGGGGVQPELELSAGLERAGRDVAAGGMRRTGVSVSAGCGLTRGQE